ncbi:MAG: DEAD/DEAH box helicase [Marinilabiliaceae bacterium]|nr:DEAD/DEAH box helicase [Marinilabiliaceae bacterium]
MKTFKETGLSPEVLKAIEELGFETPTPIQAQTIPSLLKSEQDLVALAQTGTGKTAAFGLPIIDQIQIGVKNIQSLILCPTRELCLQITEDLKKFSKYRQQLQVLPVYGGTEIRNQIKALKGDVHVVVGTPGRVNDLIRRKSLDLSNIKWLVLDEADEMLNMGFKDDLDTIIETTPEERQTLLFSATMQNEISAMANRYMKNRDEISVGKKNSGASNVKHIYYLVQARDRYDVLKRIADIYPGIYGIVFCRTRQETKDVADKLIADGYNAEALHGDLSQSQRDHVMARFRTRHLQILVATDVAARGIDINELSHVINYNLPDDPEIYVHRSGRTGRAGRSGTSIAIIHSREKGRLKDIERLSKISFERQLVPNGDDICKRQLLHFVERVENIEIDDNQINPIMDEVFNKLASIDRDDLIKRFVAAEFTILLDYYKNSPDLNIYKEESKTSRRDSSGDFSRMFINIGKSKDLSPPVLFSLISQYTGKKGIDIGKIEIMRNFSFFEIDKNWEQTLVDAFRKAFYKGEKISIEKAENKPADNERRGSYRGRDRGERRDNRDNKDNYKKKSPVRKFKRK